MQSLNESLQMCRTLLAGHFALTKHCHHALLPVWNAPRALSCLRRGSALRFIPKAPKTFVLFVRVWFLSVSKMKSGWFMFILSFFISMAVVYTGIWLPGICWSRKATLWRLQTLALARDVHNIDYYKKTTNVSFISSGDTSLYRKTHFLLIFILLCIHLSIFIDACNGTRLVDV